MPSHKTKLFRELFLITVLSILLMFIYNNGVLYKQYMCHGAVSDAWCTLEYVYSWLFIIYPILHIFISYIFLRVFKFKAHLFCLFIPCTSLRVFFASFGELGHASQLLEQIKLYFVGILSVSISYLIINWSSFKLTKA